MGRITCTDSSGKARFVRPDAGALESDGVTQKIDGAKATLVVPSSSQNRPLYCAKSNTNYFYLFISNASKCT